MGFPEGSSSTAEWQCDRLSRDELPKRRKLFTVPIRPRSAIDYHGTSYQKAIDAGAFDDGIVALLQKRGGKWQVVEYVIGATDVPYVEWNRKYRAPSEIFKEQQRNRLRQTINLDTSSLIRQQQISVAYKKDSSKVDFLESSLGQI